MGMYDDVVVHADIDLPGFPAGEPRNFQTKDTFEPLSLRRLDLTAAGRLVQITPGCYGEVDISELPQDTDFHGILNFYTYIGQNVDDWHEYNAKFTDGQLVEITRVET